MQQYSDKDLFLDRVYRKSKSEASRELAKQALNTFDKFSLDKYVKSSDELLAEIKLGKQDPYRVLDAFVGYMQSINVGANSIHVYMSWTRSYLAYCDVELTTSKFKAKIMMPKREVHRDGALTREIAAKILASTPLKLKLIAMLETTSLRRPKEISKLRGRDFDFDNKPTLISVPASIAKNRVQGETFTTSGVTQLLQYYMRTNNLTNDDVLFPYENKVSSVKAFRKVMKGLPELNTKIEGTKRYKIHLYSYKKYGYTIVDKELGKNFADGLKGDKNSEYHRMDLEERKQQYLKVEKKLDYMLGIVTKDTKSLDDMYVGYAEQQKQIEQLQKDKLDKEEIVKEVLDLVVEKVGEHLSRHTMGFFLKDEAKDLIRAEMKADPLKVKEIVKQYKKIAEEKV